MQCHLQSYGNFGHRVNYLHVHPIKAYVKQTLPIHNNLMFVKSFRIILFTTHNPFVLIYVKFVPLTDFLPDEPSMFLKKRKLA